MALDDSTNEGADCWVDGYDAGFAGKYDKDRADECANEGLGITVAKTEDTQKMNAMVSKTIQ